MVLSDPLVRNESVRSLFEYRLGNSGDRSGPAYL